MKYRTEHPRGALKDMFELMAFVQKEGNGILYSVLDGNSFHEPLPHESHIDTFLFSHGAHLIDLEGNHVEPDSTARNCYLMCDEQDNSMCMATSDRNLVPQDYNDHFVFTNREDAEAYLAVCLATQIHT